MLATESLWLGKAEGVRVTFDTRRLAFARLLEHARAGDCARHVWTTTAEQQRLAAEVVGARARPLRSMVGEQAPRRDRDQHYYLGRTALRFVPMTGVQATRVNAALHGRTLAAADLGRFLSPRQLRWLESVQMAPDADWPVALGVPFRDAVAAFRRRAARAR
ncbi:MAG TPA: hypothetical protein ENI87_08175 [bacterium]|nr:hypothetical protein [bacterium]